ncbi:MAG TPA: WYL domain-containing protein [Jiangellaceae bacterium]
MTLPAGRAQQQVGRLLSLLPYLLAHPNAKITDVANLFGVTERQILRDLNVLWFSGLPGLAMGDYIEVDMELAEGEGVINVSNAEYLARPLRLGQDEALALIVALRTLASMPGSYDRSAIERAIVKLERAAGSAAERSGDVHVDVDADAVADVAATVRRALDDKRRLHLSYWVPGRDETTERDVDPMRLALADGRLYLEGWCRRAEAERLFRLDRIAAIEILDLPAEVPPGARQRDLSAGIFQPSPDDELVTVELLPAGRWVAEYYPCESVSDGGDGRIHVQMRVADRQWLQRLLLRLGGTARVLDPPDLAAEVAARARAALAGYPETVGE